MSEIKAITQLRPFYFLKWILKFSIYYSARTIFRHYHGYSVFDLWPKTQIYFDQSDIR